MDFDWAALTAGVMTSGVAGAGLIYAAQQIKLSRNEQFSNEQWKRTEFARNLIEHFSTDDELSFCTRALDWGVGPLVIPEKHRVLFPLGVATFEHDWTKLERSVAPGLDVGWRDPESLTYRYSFDAFFSYLESIQYHLDAENLTRKQLIGLDYYIDLMKKPIYASETNSRPVSEVFRGFILKYYPTLEKFIWK